MSVLSVLQQVFPPPRYITFPSVGVDISDTSLKFIQFERKRSHDKFLTLTSCGDIVIPEGSLERGNVKTPTQLVDVLKEVKKQSGAEYMRISLPEERAFLFETLVPKDTPAKEVRGFLEFKLEENVPLSPRDAYFDFKNVGVDIASGDYRVAVSVYSRETIDAYYAACLEAKVIPLSFEIEAEAIARASVPWGVQGTYMIVDFGKTRTGVGIMHRGVLMYTSTIDVSGEGMSAALRSVLGDLPESELTVLKNTKGLRNTPEHAQGYTAIKKVVDSLREELDIRIQYWNTRAADHEGREIRKVILCGGSVNLLGLPEYLGSELKIEVERARVWQNAFSFERYVPPITERYSYGYATAIGLALSDFAPSP